MQLNQKKKIFYKKDSDLLLFTIFKLLHFKITIRLRFAYNMSLNPNFIHHSCPHCKQNFKVDILSTPSLITFCPVCGQKILEEPTENPPHLLPPPAEDVLSNRYQIQESLGRGGMGEVFLVFDSLCGRNIALKRIRSDLIDHPQIRARFLNEAHITCQLTHPAIIPIYSIQEEGLSAYYTMPFVEGQTLKQIMRMTRQQEKKGEKLHHLGGSIPALMRIFITVCQAVAYAHAKGVLHRDLKLENVIVGKYGEVLILDWGLAKYFDSPPYSEEEAINLPLIPSPKSEEITRVGKVVGTVTYMSHERALGRPATISSDIYALGVMLYQLLTLKSPFKRNSLEEFRKNMNQEQLIDPVLASPHRDVPRMLARIAEKCLHYHPQERYQTVDEMIYALENYLEGRSEWFEVADLNIHKKSDWEFQEHVLIADHFAITRETEESQWVNLMISKQSFPGNTRIETSIKLGDSEPGIGILLSVPEASERTYIDAGYCLWLGSDLYRSTQLLRSNVEVMQAPDIFLRRNEWTRIRIEKVDKSIHLYLNDILQFSYIAHLPLIGTHIGFLSRTFHFEISPFKISVGSLNLTVNCLSVPDAFLAHRDFPQALSEYRRIAYSFPDRPEGREAIFRAGLTFIEQAKEEENKLPLLENALEEFEKLHGTPGGPLEYLGKALVYQAMQDNQEEIKCFEIAYRRYPNHPLLLILQEQILSRMHEVSRQQRMATYRFLLLATRHFSSNAMDTHTKRLLSSLQKHWEQLPFLETQPSKAHSTRLRHIAIPLAFWLAKPYILGEIFDEIAQDESPSLFELRNVLMCLIQLGAWDYAQSKLESLSLDHASLHSVLWQEIGSLIVCHQTALQEVISQFISTSSLTFTFAQIEAALYLMDRAIDAQQLDLVHTLTQSLKINSLTFETQMRFKIREIQAYLWQKNWEEAGRILHTFPIEILNKETSLLHFLFECWKVGNDPNEMGNFQFRGLLEISYPRTWTLGSRVIVNDLLNKGWLEKAFLWEKRQLYSQLSLYFHCINQEEQSLYYQELYHQEWIHIKN